jgi:membrane protease YdiL (CAAX protease family)
MNLRTYFKTNFKLKIKGISPKYIPVWVVYGLSTVVWLLSNVGAPLRYSLAPLHLSWWHIGSICFNILLAVYLLFSKQKKLLFFPLFYAVQPLAYAIMYLVVTYVIGTKYLPDNIPLKFITDIFFFILEIVMFTAFLFVQKEKNPYTGKPDNKDRDITLIPIKNRKVRRNLVIAGYVLQMGVVLYMAVVTPIQMKVGGSTFLGLLGIQLVFSLLLGLKEELIFRWVYLKGMEKLFGNIWIATLIQAAAWALYHYFFGEGIPDKVIYGVVTFIGAVWFSVLVYEFKNIILATLSHALIEVFAFYLMYDQVKEVHQFFIK